MSSQFSRLIRFLQADDPLKGTHGDWSVLRVGRNRVWRAQAGPTTVYVKITDDARYYRRESHGLRISQQLADQRDWIVAPELVHADPAEHALVLSSLPGVSVAELLKNALRVDRNPFRRREPLDRFMNALSHVVRWLRAVHQVAATDRSVLFDHTTTHMRDRIHSKLQRAIQHGLLNTDEKILEAFRQLEVSEPDPEPHLVCGDATLGNFFWDGSRIGRIDFEDLGFGAGARDFSEIRQGLEYVASKRWYWSTRAATAVLPPRDNRNEDVLYRLEWALDRHWTDGRSTPTRRMRRLGGSIESMLHAVTG